MPFLGLGVQLGHHSPSSGGGGEFSNSYALSLDGANDYMNVAHDTSLNLSGSGGTFSVWVNMNTTSTTDYPYLFAKWSGSQVNYTFFTAISGVTAGYFRLRYWDGSSALSSNTDIPRGSWVHLAAVLNGTQLTYYVNGVADNTVSMGLGTTNTGDLRIGYAPNDIRAFPGLIDEAAIFNSALSASQITNIYRGEDDGGSGGTNGIPGDLSTFNSNNGPVGWWRMGDNNSGTGTIVTDQGSGGNDGTLTNGPTFSTDRPYALPSITNTYSVDFDGANDYVDLGNSSALAPTNITISLWFKASGSISSYNYLIYREGGVYGAYSLRYRSNNKFGWFLGLSGNAHIDGESSSTFTLTDWHHVAFTYDQTNIKLYVDGVEEYSAAETRAIDYSPNTNGYGSDNTTMGVGGTPPTSFSAPAEGLIDEVAIFNSALSSSDINAIYNNGTASDISSLNPVGWWRMGDGDDVGDGSGNPDGTVVGGNPQVYNMATDGSGNRITGTDGSLINGPTFVSGAGNTPGN